MDKRSPRYAAYDALRRAYREEAFLADVLAAWQKDVQPDPRDAALARELASGTMRMTAALDHYAKQLSAKGKLNLKGKEKVIVRLALYQLVFLSRIPRYAVVNEMTDLAKMECHSRFASFLHALLRSTETHTWEPPSGDDTQAMAARYSYPEAFVQSLQNAYGQKSAEAILEAGNQPPTPMARIRDTRAWEQFADCLKRYDEQIAIVTDTSRMDELGASSFVYLQNATPVQLIHELAKTLPKKPASILDLCSAPGGKAILLHDLFPEAQLFCNDPSEQRLEKLHENLNKYQIEATVTCQPGEAYTADQPFDLIVLDVPCSNSGVLNKRPEARWRLESAQLKQLEEIQVKLLTHAASLLAENGVIWYLTCSILPEENESLVTEAGLKPISPPITHLPKENGQDGGFGWALTIS